jgi:hypothetical protein
MNLGHIEALLNSIEKEKKSLPSADVWDLVKISKQLALTIIIGKRSPGAHIPVQTIAQHLTP